MTAPEALDEAAGKHAIARKNVREAAAEQPGKKPGEQPVAEHMAAAIGVFS